MKNLFLISVLTIGITLGNPRCLYADETTPTSMENIPIAVKIVLPQAGKDSKEYKYDFNAANGQELEYSKVTTLPYTVKGPGGDKVNFFEVKTNVFIKPTAVDTQIILNSQFNICLNIAPNDTDVPVIKCIHHKGVSIHKTNEFLKIVSEDNSALEQPIDLYIKVGK